MKTINNQILLFGKMNLTLLLFFWGGGGVCGNKLLVINSNVYSHQEMNIDIYIYIDTYIYKEEEE